MPGAWRTPAVGVKVLRLLDAYHFSEEVLFDNRTAAWTKLALQGPHALRLLEALGAPVALLWPLDHVVWTLAGHPVRLIRCSLTGERGYLLLTPTAHAEFLWRRIVEVGAMHGLRPAGYEALDLLRLEAGIPWYGRDMDETTLQPETGLAEAVSDNKGCYTGQEIIARVRTQGQLQRRLAGLRIEGATVPLAGDRITLDNHDVGTITSAAFSPTLKEPIALAYLHRSAQTANLTVEIHHRAGALRGRVTPLPFVPVQR